MTLSGRAEELLDAAGAVLRARRLPRHDGGRDQPRSRVQPGAAVPVLRRQGGAGRRARRARGRADGGARWRQVRGGRPTCSAALDRAAVASVGDWDDARAAALHVQIVAEAARGRSRRWPSRCGGLHRRHRRPRRHPPGRARRRAWSTASGRRRPPPGCSSPSSTASSCCAPPASAPTPRRPPTPPRPAARALRAAAHRRGGRPMTMTRPPRPAGGGSAGDRVCAPGAQGRARRRHRHPLGAGRPDRPARRARPAAPTRTRSTAGSARAACWCRA